MPRVSREIVPTPWHDNRPQLTRPVRVDHSGKTGPTEREARGRGWRRSSRGLYVPAGIEQSVEQRIIEAGMTLPSGAAITGWAALRWWGCRWFDGVHHDGTERPVVLASAAQTVLPQPGFTVCEERLDPSEIVEVDGLRVVVPARAVFFEMRYAQTLIDAVIAFDMAAFSDLVSLDEEQAYVDAHPGWTGVPRARKAMPLCDENSWSPYETRFRGVWSRAGLGRPLCNRPVFDLSGSLVGTPDLIDPLTGHIGQYEGALHLSVAQRTSDVRRDDRYRSLGMETTAAFSKDIAQQQSLIPRLLRDHARCLASAEPRAWTLEPPPWWQPAWTVSQRRALRGRARDAVLRQRSRLVS